MARRSLPEEHENHERWLISYADFITLLFAFFVVMYAVSSVNEGKYRVLSESLDEAFNESPLRSLDPVQVGELLRAENRDSSEPPAVVDAPYEESGAAILQLAEAIQSAFTGEGTSDHESDGSSDYQNDGTSEQNNIGRIADELLNAVSPLIEEDLIEMRVEDSWLEIEMKSNVLFGSGSAQLQPQAIPALEELAKVLSGFNNPVQVEGYTDDRPISSATFPSNWELSVTRAASVVHLFARSAVDPVRLSAVGYGEFHPIADNKTPEGRQENRRVVIIVSADPRRQSSEDAKVYNAESMEEEKRDFSDLELRRVIEYPGLEGPD